MLLNRASPAARPQVEKILRYYEGANFARRIRIPVRMYMGLADTVCPPFSIWAIYNSIASGDKDVRLDEAMGHGMSGSARAEFDSWLFRRR